MESRFNRGKQEQEMNDQDGHQTSFAEAYSIAKDWGKDFRLLINHKPIENLDTDNLEQVPLDAQLTSSNIGYRLLQKMRWKGIGLGKDKQAIAVAFHLDSWETWSSYYWLHRVISYGCMFKLEEEYKRCRHPRFCVGYHFMFHSEGVAIS